MALFEFFLYNSAVDFEQGRWSRRFEIEKHGPPAHVLDIDCSDTLGVALTERYNLRRYTSRDARNTDHPSAHYVFEGVAEEDTDAGAPSAER